MTTTRTIDSITSDLWSHADGITVPTVVGVKVPTTGYVVAIPEYGVQLTSPVDIYAVRNWVAHVLPYALEPSQYVGSWTNEGQTYLDVVEILSERQTALGAALARGEIAIYDLAKGEDILV